jgi:hypothetical protein
MAKEITVYYDKEGDYFEVMFEKKEIINSGIATFFYTLS